MRWSWWADTWTPSRWPGRQRQRLRSRGTAGDPVHLGSTPPVTNAVRFAFWGAQEVGAVGSSNYVEELADEERARIALYLNVDLVASPNPGYLVLDGDDSDRVGQGPGPNGSAVVERVLVEALAAARTITPSSRRGSRRADCSPAPRRPRRRNRPSAGVAPPIRPTIRATTRPATASTRSTALPWTAAPTLSLPRWSASRSRPRSSRQAEGSAGRGRRSGRPCRRAAWPNWNGLPLDRRLPYLSPLSSRHDTVQWRPPEWCAAGPGEGRGVEV
jgi:hypothetical protein